jgi:hypothetical protein
MSGLISCDNCSLYSVAQRENRAKVIEIQNRLIGLGPQYLVEPQRIFIKEGVLYKLSMTDNSLQTRAVYLFNDLFVTATPLVGGYLKLGTFFNHH